MKTSKHFLKLTAANLKRLKKQLPAILFVSIVVFACLAIAGNYIATHMYQSESREPFGIAFYIPEVEDSNYKGVVVNMLQNVNTIKQTVKLIQVDTEEEGYRMLDDDTVSFFVLIPEGFFSGIVHGNVPPIQILVHDKNSIISYIANELFTAYAKYLSVDVAATFSVNEAALALDVPTETRHAYLEKLDLAYLDRTLNKDAYLRVINPTNEGVFTLLEHYTGVALLLTISFIGFFLIAMFHDMNAGMKNRLSLAGIKTPHLLISNTITSLAAYYAGSLPCVILIGFYNRHINPIFMLRLFPALLILALMTAIAVSCSAGPFSGSLLYFCVILLITYVGGGVLPQALLPAVVRTASNFLPGKFMIEAFCTTIFGGV